MALGISAAIIGGTALVGSIYTADKAAGASKAGARAAEVQAKFQADIANRELDLAERQYDDQSALLKEYTPMLKDLITRSTVAQDKATAQSDSQWADYTATWRPVEQQLAQRSLDWASPQRQDQAAQRAAGSVAQNFDTARQQTRESLQRGGADASTIAALEASGRLEEAKAKAGASDTARRDVEKEGMAYVDNASRFGRSMPSTGIATAQLAGTSGQQAQGGYGALTAAVATPASSAASLFNNAANQSNMSGNMSLGAGNAMARGYSQQQGIFGDIMGGAAQIYGMFGSSKTTKKVGKKVDGKAASRAVEKSPSLGWAYKPGEGDGSTKPRMGPMAEDLRDATGGTVSDGKKVDGIAMLGLHHAAIGDQSARLRRVEKKLALAGAK